MVGVFEGTNSILSYSRVFVVLSYYVQSYSLNQWLNIFQISFAFLPLPFALQY
jgi:hypothetical protein